jgi:hypothetical protein
VRRNGMDRMFVAILACAAAVLVIGTTWINRTVVKSWNAITKMS